MKRFKCFAAGMLLFCALAGFIPGRAEAEEYESAIYIYMCGSTLETRRGCATDNIAELLAADIPEDTCVVIQTGGARRWRDYDISSDCLTRFVITSGEMREIEKIDEASMGSGQTLEDFLIFCGDNYPAENTGLIFWDHGSGSVGGVCFDENYSMDALTIPEFADALGVATGNGQKRYDFIGFDACLMANYETASAICSYADYMIASEELEPLGGWDYAVLAEKFGEDTFYQDLLDSYAGKCAANEVGVYTLSCMDLTQFELVETAFDDFLTSLEKTAEENLHQVVAAASEAMSFGYNSEAEGYSNMFDLAAFAENLGHSELAEAIGGITACVNSPTKEDSGGISVFYPLENVEQVERYVIYGNNERYNRFLTENYSDIPTSGLIEFEDRGSERNDELFVCVTKDSMKFVKSVEYKLFQVINLNDEEQMALCLGTDTDIDVVGREYTSSFGGKWVVWGDKFVYASAIERVGNVTTFSTPVMLNGQKGAVRFIYDIAQRSFEIQGFLSENDAGAMSRLYELQSGDEITLIYQEISPEYEELWCIGDNFVYNRDCKLKAEYIPEGRYLISLRFRDVFGNIYRSNTALIEYKDGRTDCLEIMDDIQKLKFRSADERI